MNTLIISDLSLIDQAALIIKNGGLVAVPTETVYGLAANGLNPDAVLDIYKAKGRPNDNPLILHIDSLDMLRSLVKEISEEAMLLIHAFWPGPLTLIFNSSNKVPSVTRAGLNTVAIRFPSHPVMNALISNAQLPLAAPSANTSGKPSPTNAKRVIEDLYGKVDAIIDGGECSYGLESTVIDTTSKPFTILRPGAITYDMIKEVIGDIAMDPALMTHNSDLDLVPKAPGMKYTHYSPNAQVVIVQGEPRQVISKIKELCLKEAKNGKSIGVLATDELLEDFSPYLVLSVGKSMDSLEEIASNLFEVLRKFDDHEVDIIYSIAFPSLGIGQAIMNRLEKSAGYAFINA